MDRRTILAIVLAFGVYYTWMTYMRVKYPPPPEADLPEVATVEPAPVAPVAGPAPIQPETLPVREIPFEACGAVGTWSTDGGVLTDVRLPDHQAPFEVTPIWRYVMGRFTGGLSGGWKPYGDEPGVARLVSEKGRVLAMGSGDLAAAPPRTEVVSAEPEHVILRGVTADGIEVTRDVTSEHSTGRCLLAITTTWRNVGDQPFDGNLWLSVHDHMRATDGRYDNTLQPYAEVNGKFRTVKKVDKLLEPETYEGPVDWFAVADRYFALVFLPADGAAGQLWFSPWGPPGDDQLHGEHYVVRTPLAVGASHTETFRAYVGPKELSTLGAIDSRLKDLVPLGWFAFFGRILLWMLVFFHQFVPNWGLSIILLTFVLKALFFPLTQASFKSSQAMQNLQPELAALREKLKDDPQQLNQRTMELFRERGVNPLGGCLPMLVQLPVWIALYQVLLNSVELYHTEFLYMRDLSAVDPYSALPAVVVVLMVVQQQFMPTGNMDPTQAQMMKWMPLIFGIFFFTFPSGLVVYIFVNMVLTILQQWVIKRTYQQPAVAAVAS